MEDERAWQTAQGVAYIVLTRNVIIKGMENITHYHHKDINPVWAKDLEYCGTIQDHMFYRLFKNQVMLSR
jgi:spore germination cell wall hydrolase CwlJ-like protein